jgi:hypothetical protein
VQKNRPREIVGWGVASTFEKALEKMEEMMLEGNGRIQSEFDELL